MPMTDKPETRKKPRAVKPRMEIQPDTSIQTLQQAGKILEIDVAELSEDKLMAASKAPTSQPSSNDS